MIDFAIAMATYKRKDGSTYEKIKRAINSISSQTHYRWKLFLVGDRYEDDEEFAKIVSMIPPEKIVYENLPVAEERDSKSFEGTALWCSAGCNAYNHSIGLANKAGYQILCHLDDDDEWLPNHLAELNKTYTMFPESVFVYTRSIYLHTVLPRQDMSNAVYYNNLMPTSANLVHSSASWRIDKIPFLYRNTLEQQRVCPADADMWGRIESYCVTNGAKVVHNPTTTVAKYDEGQAN